MILYVILLTIIKRYFSNSKVSTTLFVMSVTEVPLGEVERAPPL